MKKATTRMLVYCLFVLQLLAHGAWSQGLPETTAESAGLSQDRLANITAVMQKHVDEKKLAGAVAVVARRGKVAYLQSVGKQDIEADVDMNANTIFRIASMTKPITSVAALMLYDDGLIQLDDPVSKYIPEFSKPTVLRRGQQRKTAVPATQEITIKHLLTHTSQAEDRPTDDERSRGATQERWGGRSGCECDQEFSGIRRPGLRWFIWMGRLLVHDLLC